MDLAKIKQGLSTLKFFFGINRQCTKCLGSEFRIEKKIRIKPNMWGLHPDPNQTHVGETVFLMICPSCGGEVKTTGFWGILGEIFDFLGRPEIFLILTILAALTAVWAMTG